MLAYVDLLPTGLWRFANVHYFKWIFPLLGLFAWRLLRDARSSPRLAAACLLGWTAVSGLHFVTVPAQPGEAARRIDFPAPARADFDGVYFATAVIADGRRTQRSLFDYHQVLVGDRVIAVALRHDFAPGSRSYPSGTAATVWPAGIPIPASTPTATAPITPIARWKTRLVWSVPCWIAPCPTAIR